MLAHFQFRRHVYFSQHRRFFGCDLDSDCVTSGLPQLAPFFNGKGLRKKSDITRGNNLQQAAFTFAKEMEELHLRYHIDV